MNPYAMNDQADPTPGHNADDAALKAALQHLAMPAPLSADQADALQSRILAQWQEACGGVPASAPAVVAAGGSGLLAGHGSGRPWRVLALALLLGIAGVAWWWAQQPDPMLDDELMQPDVLSLMAIGEM